MIIQLIKQIEFKDIKVYPIPSTYSKIYNFSITVSIKKFTITL